MKNFCKMKKKLVLSVSWRGERQLKAYSVYFTWFQVTKSKKTCVLQCVLIILSQLRKEWNRRIEYDQTNVSFYLGFLGTLDSWKRGLRLIGIKLGCTKA